MASWYTSTDKRASLPRPTRSSHALEVQLRLLRPSESPAGPAERSGLPFGLASSGLAMLAEMSGPGSDADVALNSNRASDPHVDVRPKRSANVVYCQVTPSNTSRPAHRSMPRPALPPRRAAGLGP